MFGETSYFDACIEDASFRFKVFQMVKCGKNPTVQA